MSGQVNGPSANQIEMAMAEQTIFHDEEVFHCDTWFWIDVSF